MLAYEGLVLQMLGPILDEPVPNVARPVRLLFATVVVLLNQVAPGIWLDDCPHPRWGNRQHVPFTLVNRGKIDGQKAPLVRCDLEMSGLNVRLRRAKESDQNRQPYPVPEEASRPRGRQERGCTPTPSWDTQLRKGSHQVECAHLLQALGEWPIHLRIGDRTVARTHLWPQSPPECGGSVASSEEEQAGEPCKRGPGTLGPDDRVAIVRPRQPDRPTSRSPFDTTSSTRHDGRGGPGTRNTCRRRSIHHLRTRRGGRTVPCPLPSR